MLTHLDEVTVPLDKLVLGFTNMEPKPTWGSYLDTWRLIDDGEQNILNLPLYKLMKKHYCSKNKKRLQREKTLLGIKSDDCETIAYTWVKKHVELYHSIRIEGYHPEMRTKPVRVHIMKDGGLFLLDGTHTVSILRHLGYNTIQAKIHSRDEEWLTLKNKLYGIYGKKLLYQPINHPDFADWEVDRPSPHRWITIKKALGDVDGCKIMDMGSCTGWFSIELAKLGAEVTGLEPHEKRVHTSKVLAGYEGLTSSNPCFLMESFEEHLPDKHYDICLTLSVLHHYLRANPESFYDAVNLISGSCDKMILEMGINRMPIPWSPELVLKYSKYSKYRTLYEGERPIYLYEK